MKVIFEGKTLFINSREIETPFPIREAFAAIFGVIVLMDQFAALKGPVLDIREIRNLPKGTNLFCYSPDGTVMWKAELPTDDKEEDYYYRISSRSPLIVNSFSSFRCEIDPATGKIVRKEFYK